MMQSPPVQSIRPMPPMPPNASNGSPSNRNPFDFESIGTPRLRRLWGPVQVNGSPAVQRTPRSNRVKQSNPSQMPSSRNDSVVSRFEATGSLLPQPSTSSVQPTPRSVDDPSEQSFSFSAIRQVHAIILQSSVDLNFGGAMERVLTAAKTLTNCGAAKIFFLEKSDALDSSGSTKLRLKSKGPQDSLFPCEGLAGICAEDNVPILCNRPYHDARFNSEIDSVPGSSSKTVACAPMVNLVGKVVGVIEVFNKCQGGFREEDLCFLDLLGKQAALTFELCIKNEARQVKAKKMNSMLKGFVKLASLSSPKDLAHHSGLLAREITGAMQANCFMLSDENEIHSLTSWSKIAASKADILEEKQIPLSGFISEIFRESRSVFRGGSAEKDPRACRNHLGSLYCPIMAHNKPVGIIQARNKKGGHFVEADESMMTTLSAFVAQLHDSLSRNKLVAKDPEKKWASVQELVSSIKQTLKAAVNVHTVCVLFHEPVADNFWTLQDNWTSGNKDSYIRLSGSHFPLQLVTKQKGPVHFPSDSGYIYSDHEIMEMRALTRRFIGDDLPLESMLAIPLMSHGECVSIILLINKHNASGPFDLRSAQIAEALASKWGNRVHATLEAESAAKFLRHFEVTMTDLPALVSCRKTPDLLKRLNSFIQEHVAAERCWIVLADKKGTHVWVLDGNELEHHDPSECWVITETMQSRKPVLLRDAKHDWRRAECWLWREAGVDCQSLLCCPFFENTDIPTDAPPGSAGSGSSFRRPRLSGQSFHSKSFGGNLSTLLGAECSGVILLVNKVGVVDRFSDSDISSLKALCPLVNGLLESTQRAEEVVRLQDQMRASFSQLRMVLGEAATVHHSPGVHGLLTRIRSTSKKLLHANQCNIFLVGHGKSLMCELQDDLYAFAKFEAVAGIVGYVLKSGDVVHHSDDDPESMFLPEVDERNVVHAYSMVCAPLIDSDGQIIGAIEILNCNRSADAKFTPEDGQFLVNFGEHVTAALLNGNVISKLRHCNNRLTQLPLLKELREQIAFVSSSLEHIITAERINIFVRQGLRFYCDECFSGAKLTAVTGEGYVGRCASTKSVTHIADTMKDKQFLLTVDGRDAIHVHRAFYIPILDKNGECSIVIEMLNKQSGAFNASDEEIGKVFGTHLAGFAVSDEVSRRQDQARRRSLLLLTSFTYLFPVEPDADKMVGGVIQQCSSLLQCSTRLFLATYDQDGVHGANWTCFSVGGRRSVVPVAGTPGEAFLKAEPKVVDSIYVGEGEEFRDVDADASGLRSSSTRYTTTFFCQPLMDSALRRPVGVLELRRGESGPDCPLPFSYEDQEFVFSFSGLIVSSLLHHERLITRNRRRATTIGSPSEERNVLSVGGNSSPRH